MKTIALTSTVAAVVLGTSALAGPVEDLVAQLTADGYTQIEVEVEGEVTEIEAMLNGIEREIEINSATGEILSDKTETEDDDSDEDSDDDSDDDSDEDDTDEDQDDA